jgi:hypothetical protein
MQTTAEAYVAGNTAIFPHQRVKLTRLMLFYLS